MLIVSSGAQFLDLYILPHLLHLYFPKIILLSLLLWLYKSDEFENNFGHDEHLNTI